MSWETYHELKKCLHIDVDVLINHLNHKFSQYWEPSSNITADKSLVPTKAQCLWSVIIKHKPHPKGVKLWSIINKSKFLYTISLFKKVTKKTVTTILHMVGGSRRGPCRAQPLLHAQLLERSSLCLVWPLSTQPTHQLHFLHHSLPQQPHAPLPHNGSHHLSASKERG